jgi:hypothetical protein
MHLVALSNCKPGHVTDRANLYRVNSGNTFVEVSAAVLAASPFDDLIPVLLHLHLFCGIASANALCAAEGNSRTQPDDLQTPLKEVVISAGQAAL